MSFNVVLGTHQPASQPATEQSDMIYEFGGMMNCNLLQIVHEGTIQPMMWYISGDRGRGGVMLFEVHKNGTVFEPRWDAVLAVSSYLRTDATARRLGDDGGRMLFSDSDEIRFVFRTRACLSIVQRKNKNLTQRDSYGFRLLR